MDELLSSLHFTQNAPDKPWAGIKVTVLGLAVNKIVLEEDGGCECKIIVIWMFCMFFCFFFLIGKLQIKVREAQNLKFLKHESTETQYSKNIFFVVVLFLHDHVIFFSVD